MLAAGKTSLLSSDDFPGGTGSGVTLYWDCAEEIVHLLDAMSMTITTAG